MRRLKAKHTRTTSQKSIKGYHLHNHHKHCQRPTVITTIIIKIIFITFMITKMMIITTMITLARASLAASASAAIALCNITGKRASFLGIFCPTIHILVGCNVTVVALTVFNRSTLPCILRVNDLVFDHYSLLIATRRRASFFGGYFFQRVFLIRKGILYGELATFV